MSEKQPTHQKLPPEVIGEWELTEADRKLLGLSDPNTSSQVPEVQNPYQKLSEADEELLENQDFYSAPETQETGGSLDSDTEKPQGETEESLLDFDPVGSNGTYVVQRTSGNMDEGWFPTAKEEVTTKKGEKYWVATVYKDTDEGRLTKTVRIEDLKVWNTPTDESSKTNENTDKLDAGEKNSTGEEESKEQQDQLNEVELKAGEILSFSEQLRMMIRESASENVTATQSALNKARAFLGRPRTKLLERRLAKAQAKYDRRTTKQDTSRFEFRNKRFDAKAQKAYSELQESIKALDARNNLLKARESNVTEKGVERSQAIEARKRELIDKRIKAETRKQRRLEQRTRRQDRVAGESFQERENRVRNFTAEDERRIRLLAIEALKSRN